MPVVASKYIFCICITVIMNTMLRLMIDPDAMCEQGFTDVEENLGFAVAFSVLFTHEA